MKADLTGMTILLVEDEALLALAEGEFLESQGFKIINAFNALDAVAYVEDKPVDLILMDIDLGHGCMEGTEAAELILKKHNLPIVFCTSHSEKDYVDKVKSITNYGYVIKNSGEFVLYETVCMALELFHSNKELKKRNHFIETTLDNLPIGLAVNFLDDGHASYMNKKFEEIYGWPSNDLLDIENFFKCVYPDENYRNSIKRKITEDIESGNPENMEWEGIEITSKNGSKKVIKAKNIPIPEQNFMISTVQDMSEQKAAEKALKKSETELQTVFERLPVPILISTGDEEKILRMNKKFREVIGYSIAEIPDIAHWWPLAYPDEEYRKKISREWQNKMQKSFAEKKEIEPVPAYITCKNGSVGYFSVHLYSFNKLHIVAFTDLTAINDLNRALESALDGKELMLREINHRIKNNLFMISSLISMKDDSLGDGADLSDLKSQLDSVRIVYEKLQQTEALNEINFREYTADLLSSVFSFSNTPVNVKSKIKVDFLPVEKVIPLGLIVNEIATNAVKHGFGNSGNSFEISIEKENTTLIMHLSNSGNPFPDHIDPAKPETLGLTLVSTLVKQLGGSLELKRNPRTEFKMIFPLPQP